MLGCNVAADVCCAALCGAAVVRWPVQTWDCVTLATGHGVSSVYTVPVTLPGDFSDKLD